MNKQELHDFIGFRQPNIYVKLLHIRMGQKFIQMNGMVIKKTILVISCQQRKVLYLC